MDLRNDLDRNRVRQHWHEIRSLVRRRWREIAETDLDSASGNLDQLASVLQKTFGWTLEHAEREYREFRKGLPRFVESDAPTGAEERRSLEGGRGDEDMTPPLA